MGKDTTLPKNIRQIGDIQDREKICIEDYVMTYIRKKEPQEAQGFLGIFFGERKETKEEENIFVRGILEMPGEEEEEKLRECFERERAGHFPDWEIVGCCVIGTYPARRMEQLARLAPGSEQMIYHLQEQEENIYRKEQGSYRKMKGYLVFYEQNQPMQDYLAELYGENSVEKESSPDQAMKSFRRKVKEKGEQKSRSLLKLASSFFVITVLAVGAIVVNRIDELRTAVSDGVLNKVAQDTVGATTGEDSSAVEETAQNTVLQEETAVQDTAGTGEMTPGADSFWEEAAFEDETETQTAGGSAAAETEEDFGGEAAQTETSEAVSRQIQASYVIRDGDTLANICKKYYGSMERLQEICEANNITDANLILPGQKIVLP